MAEVPKIVHHRLRAATRTPETLEQSHPEADVLTAFAEQALAASEREGVLQHLALCGECRDVVALALPEIDLAAPPIDEAEGVVARAAEHKENRFSWARLNWGYLRWATLAAGIAVAVFVVRTGFERMGKPYTAMNSAANQVSLPAAQPGSTAQVVPEAQPSNSIAENVADKDAAKTRAESERQDVESKLAVNGKTASLGHRRTPVPAPESEMQLAGNLVAPGDMKQSGAMKKGAISAGMPATPGREFGASAAANKREADKSELSKSTIDSSSTTVEVAAGGSAVSTEEAALAEPSLMARADVPRVQNAPRIEKAKPALDQMASRDAAVGGRVNESQQPSAQNALTSPGAASSQDEASRATLAMKAATPSAKLERQTATWTIADGVLQRSLDGGHTWQTAARADHALLCYANRGQEVWAGGQAGTLLHSSDSGATWSAVAVSSNGQALSSDVTHLDLLLILRPPLRIVLSTDTHETWSSSDGGKTWEKK